MQGGLWVWWGWRNERAVDCSNSHVTNFSMAQRRREFVRRLSEITQMAQCRQFAYSLGFLTATESYHNSQAASGKEQQM